MFPELRDYLNEVEATSESTGAFLHKLNGARTRLRNAIEKSQQDVKNLKDENKHFAKIRTEIEKSTLKTAKNILFFNAKHAYLINEEFNEPPYRNALFQAIENNETYMFRRIGSGFSGKLILDINLDRTGGRIHSWAAGIKAYRKVLEQEKEQKARERAERKKKRYKKPDYNPLAASRAWAGIFERRSGTFSEFQTTIRQRLALSGAVAPFWMLLDKGAIPMKSDRGGFPTPHSTETGFVHDSEQEINTLISNTLKDERKRYYELFAEYEEFISVERNRLARLDELANQIRLDLKVVRQLEKQLGFEESQINRNKFEKAVELIRKELLTEGRIDITARGSRRRVRPTVSAIREALL